MSLSFTTAEPLAGPFSIFARLRAESARRSAAKESARQLRRAQLAIKFGDYRLARRQLCKALAAANAAKSSSRADIFRAMNYCQSAARANGAYHA